MKAILASLIAGFLVALILSVPDSIASANPNAQVMAGATPQTEVLSPTLKWKVEGHLSADGPPYRRVHAKIVSSGNLLFYPSYSEIVALEKETGQVVWVFDPEFEGKSWSATVTSPVVSGDILLVSVYHIVDFGFYPEKRVSFGYVFGLDAKTGKERWRFQTDEAIVTTPAVMKGVAFFGTGHDEDAEYGRNAPSGQLYALDLATGEVRWKLPLMDAEISEEPVAANGVVYFLERVLDRNRVGYLYAVDAKSGKEKWSFPTDKNLYFTLSPILLGNAVYVVNKNYGDDRLYAVDTESGRRRWDFTVERTDPDTRGVEERQDSQYSLVASIVITSIYTPDAGINALPAIDGKAVYLAVNEDTGIPHPEGQGYGNMMEYFLVALDIKTGRELWRYKSDEEVLGDLVIADGYLLFTTDLSDHLQAVNAKTGRLEWAYDAREYVRGTPLALDGVIYFGGKDNLYALVPPLNVGMPTAGIPIYAPLFVLLLGVLSAGLGLALNRTQSRAHKRIQLRTRTPKGVKLK